VFLRGCFSCGVFWSCFCFFGSGIVPGISATGGMEHGRDAGGSESAVE